MAQDQLTEDPITAEPHFEPRHGHRIVCAAVKLADGRVVCGVRHFDTIMRRMLPESLDEARAVLKGHEEGFVDNKYQFLTREQAYELAEANGQHAHGEGSDGRLLFSEDLW